MQPSDCASRPLCQTATSIRQLDPLADPTWDAKLAALPGATIFHSAAWARVLHGAYGFRPQYFCEENEGALTGLLPVIEVNSWLTGRRGVCLPFADTCAPLCADHTACAKLLATATALGKTKNWRYLEVRGGRTLLDQAPAATSFYGHVLDLSVGPVNLFASYDSAVRRAVRKAEKSELVLTFSRDLEAVRAFHQLLCITRKRHGVPPQPFSFFAQLHQHILAPGKGWVVLARYQGQPVAGAVFFHFGQTALYKYGASDEAFQQLRANNLVMARSIEWHAQNGFTAFDFGRTSTHNSGLRNFKLGWGAQESQIDYVRIDPRKGTFLSAPDREGGLAQRIFNHLPIPLSRLIGSALYRHAA